MAQPHAPALLSNSDFDAIEAAVKETARGRWFLSEFARRNRHADTSLVLDAVNKLERNMLQQRETVGMERLRFDLIEMSRAISQTRAEISAIKPEAAPESHIMFVSGELDAIVQTTEQATSDILAAAESIQELAWTLREEGVATTACDGLDREAIEIYTACSFQDLTAQRTRKVIDTLAFLETRINAMIEIWNFGPPDSERKAAPEAMRPQGEGANITQSDVDTMLGHKFDEDFDKDTSLVPRFPAPEQVELPPIIVATAHEFSPQDDILFDPNAELPTKAQRLADPDGKVTMLQPVAGAALASVEAIDTMPLAQRVKLFT